METDAGDVMSREDLELLLCTKIPNISGKKIWIWGAGDTAQLYQEGFRRLEAEGFQIEGYADQRIAQLGQKFNSKPVIEPKQLTSLENTCVLICTAQSNVIQEIAAQCEQLHLEWYLVDEVILKTHRQEVMKCYDWLEDQQSKDVYASLIQWRISGVQPNAKIEQQNIYFALEAFTQTSSEEVFVDCGAYVGDTIEAYLKKKNGIFKKIIAFEPDPVNFERLKQQIAELCEKKNFLKNRFDLYPHGIGESLGMAQLERYEENRGIGSKVIANSEGEGNCKIVALDVFLQEPYTFLKADIESYEYQMLLGARKGITENEPLLAICIYHNAVDFYSVPLLIKQILPKYHLAVRHHSENLAETVLYAWV